MNEVMQHWLDKRADLSPNDNAIEMPNGKGMTFMQLRNHARTFARKLATLPISKGSHVAIYANNSLDMAVAIHSVSYIGAVAVLLNTKLTSKEIAYQLTNADVALVVSADELLAEAEQAAELGGTQVISFSKLDELQEADIPLLKEINLNQLYTIIYTSGTTGYPKGVQHTYGNHWWSAIASALNLGLNHKDKWLASLPLFHVSGLSTLMKSIIYGMPVYLLEKFDVDTVHSAIMEKGVTIVSVVSVTMQRLLTKLRDEQYPDTFRCMLLGGGPASKFLLEQAKAYHVPVFQTYGMTETSSQIVTLSPVYALNKLGSAGKALFPAQLQVIKDGKPAPFFEVGEITVKGPMVTSGYYQNDKANNEVFKDGWLSTGDLGYLDEEGFLYVMDRRKDLIISGGENIYPAEVESVLSGISGVKDAGVIGKEDDEWGQVPVAFIVRDQHKVDKDTILHACYHQLAKYKVPKEIYFVDHLPRNAANKLVRHKLVEWL